MEIKPVFDHLRDWTLRCYKGYWWLMRQYWTEELWFRVRDDELHRGHRFVALNRTISKGEYFQELVQKGMSPPEALATSMGPDGELLLRKISQELQAAQQAQMQQMQLAAQQQGVPPQQLQPPPQQDPMQLLLQSPLALEEFTSNDVAQMDVDIVLDAEPSSPIVRQEQYSELLTLASTTLPLTQDPEVIQKMVALIYQHSDLRTEAKRQFAEALMPKPPSPQEQAAEQQMLQAQQLQLQQMQMEVQEMQAKMQKLQSETAKNQVQAQKLAQEAQLTVPAAAQLDQAQAAKTVAETQLIPSEGQLLQAQAAKTAVEAEVAATEPKVPAGTQERP
jgi:hypothetical protein